MNRQRKVVITITYNEMGIIIDAKAEEVAQPNLQSTCNELATDCISRQAAIDALDCINGVEEVLKALPSAQPERLKGKWIPHKEKSREYIGGLWAYIGYDYWFCDACGYRVEKGQPMYNFCPHCGARMDGEEDG